MNVELKVVDNSTYQVHVYLVTAKTTEWCKLSKPCAYLALYQAQRGYKSWWGNGDLPVITCQLTKQVGNVIPVFAQCSERSAREPRPASEDRDVYQSSE